MNHGSNIKRVYDLLTQEEIDALRRRFVADEDRLRWTTEDKIKLLERRTEALCGKITDLERNLGGMALVILTLIGSLFFMSVFK